MHPRLTVLVLDEEGMPVDVLQSPEPPMTSAFTKWSTDLTELFKAHIQAHIPKKWDQMVVFGSEPEKSWMHSSKGKPSGSTVLIPHVVVKNQRGGHWHNCASKLYRSAKECMNLLATLRKEMYHVSSLQSIDFCMLVEEQESKHGDLSTFTCISCKLICNTTSAELETFWSLTKTSLLKPPHERSAKALQWYAMTWEERVHFLQFLAVWTVVEVLSKKSKGRKGLVGLVRILVEKAWRRKHRYLNWNLFHSFTRVRLVLTIVQ